MPTDQRNYGRAGLCVKTVPTMWVFFNHPKCRKLMLTQTHCVESRLDLLSAIRAFAGCGRPGGPRFLRVVLLGPGSLVCSRKRRRQRTRQAKLHAATNQSINRPQSGFDKPAAPQPAIKTENGEGGTHDAIQKKGGCWRIYQGWIKMLIVGHRQADPFPDSLGEACTHRVTCGLPRRLHVRVFLPIRCFFPGTDPEFKPPLKQWGSMQSTTMVYLRIVIVTGPFF